MSEQKPRNIVRGQDVCKDRIEFANHLRKDMSPVERILWRRLRANQMAGFHFRRQQIVGPYIADFYCHSAALAIEIDGDTHENLDYDARRDGFFAGRGIRVMRFTNQQVVRQTDDVLQAVWEFLARLRTSP